MKEYITREIKKDKYEYGYKIQLLDIKMMLELEIKIPNKMEEIYKEKIKELDLSEYVYFNDPEVYEFIRRQYYIRDNNEFTNMNLYELELLLKFYDKRVEGLSNRINIVSNKERLIELETSLKVLTNEMNGVMSLRDSLINSYNKKK